MNSIDRLYAEEIPGLVISPDGTTSESLPDHALVLAGSFNPLHAGHIRMLSAASQLTGRDGYYEISVMNVDKPMLPREELEHRAKQVASTGESLIVTSAPRFTEKSSILPDTQFVIGFDTFIRLLDPRYYPDHVAGVESAVDNSLDLIEENGCGFVVAGRVDHQGNFRGLSETDPPARFRKMFTGLTESQFRSDISSTELRRQST